jgi:hypothetical protein
MVKIGGEYLLAGIIALTGAASFKLADDLHAEYVNCDRVVVATSSSGQPVTQCKNYNAYVGEDKVPLFIGGGVLLEVGDTVLLAGLALGETRRRRLCSVITSKISPKTDSQEPDAEQHS